MDTDELIRRARRSSPDLAESIGVQFGGAGRRFRRHLQMVREELEVAADLWQELSDRADEGVTSELVEDLREYVRETREHASPEQREQVAKLTTVLTLIAIDNEMEDDPDDH